tara:strand:+ start:361 stop:2073 length:1713 start_codon:yes stop_codon:yes gene_type:complete
MKINLNKNIIFKNFNKNLHFIYLPISLLLIAFLFEIIASLFSSYYDWDIDTHMYFGMRLLKGQLYYINEFDDKLPFLQILFAIPAFFKSVKIWIIFSIIMTLVTSFQIFNFLNFIFRNEYKNISDNNSFRISILSSVLYLFFISNLWGNISQINAIATNFAVLSLVTYFLEPLKFKKNQKKINYLLNFFLSAFFASAAISIRPYLLFSLLLVPIWKHSRVNLLEDNKTTLFLKGNSSRFHILRLLKIFVNWSLSIFALGMTINFVPYFLKGNHSQFLDGLYFNSQEITPWMPIESTKSQLIHMFILMGNIQSLLYLSFLLPIITLSIYFLFKKFRNSSLLQLNKLIILDFFFISFLSPLMIQILITLKLFHSHYLQLFSGYSSISFGLSLFLLKNYLKNFLKIEIKLDLIFIIIIFLFSIFLGRNEIIKISAHLSYITKPHNYDSNLEKISIFLDKRKTKNLSVDFLYPDGIYVHWKLSEERHGFPPAAHFSHIQKNYWKDLELGLNNSQDYSSKGFCRLINNKGPSLIFSAEGTSDFKCLEKFNSYTKISKIDEHPNGKDLYVFEKMKN